MPEDFFLSKHVAKIFLVKNGCIVVSMYDVLDLFTLATVRFLCTHQCNVFPLLLLFRYEETNIRHSNGT